MSKDDTEIDGIDPDDAPELDDAWFDKADFKVGGAVVRKGGRPSQDKVQVTLRIDRATIERFRAGGPGWQTRINDALKQAG